MAQGPGPKTLAHPLIQRVVLLFLASSSSPNPTQSKATVKGILHWLSRSPFSSLSSLSFSLFSISNPLLLYFFLFPVCLSVCLCVCQCWYTWYRGSSKSILRGGPSLSLSLSLSFLLLLLFFFPVQEQESCANLPSFFFRFLFLQAFHIRVGKHVLGAGPVA